MNKFLIALTLVCVLFSVQAKEKRKVVDITYIEKNTHAIYEADHIYLGFAIHFSKGKPRKTRGVARGMYSWNKLDVSVQNGTFKDGILSYDLNELWLNQESVAPEITVKVTSRKNPEVTRTFVFEIPKIKSVEVKPHVAITSKHYMPPYTAFMHLDNGSSLSIPKETEYLFIQPKLEYIGSSTYQGISIPDSAYLRGTSDYFRVSTAKDLMAIDYSLVQTFDFSGRSGADGYSGANGADYGRYSCDGERGGDGGDGYNGEDGEDVTLYIDKIARKYDDLIALSISSKHTKKGPYIINPSTSQILINACGGNGGNGGAGGCGGDGADETSDRAAGSGGTGGTGGTGGDGGHGGTITIKGDSQSLKFFEEVKSSSFAFRNYGGQGGKKGSGGYDGDDGECSGGGSAFLNFLSAVTRLIRSPGNPGYKGGKGAIHYVETDALQNSVK